MLKRRLNIALVVGGYTQEAAVSRVSANNVRASLDSKKMNVYTIVIERDSWYYEDEPAESNSRRITVDRNDFSVTINGIKVTFDCAVVHIAGSPGEDGKLQGYFDMIHMPYVGCSNVISSAITMNKGITTAVAGYFGVDVANSVCVDKSAVDLSVIAERIRFPVVVKANNGGSSINTSYVETIDQLSEALNQVFEEDHQALVEEALVGREFTAAVCKIKSKITTFPVTEIILETKFNDFKTKYASTTKSQTPANIDKSLEEKIHSVAVKVYQTMHCSCLARMDFIYNEKEDKVYLLEVNSIPGQRLGSPATLQVQANGLSLTDLYTGFIEEALNLS